MKWNEIWYNNREMKWDEMIWNEMRWNPIRRFMSVLVDSNLIAISLNYDRKRWDEFRWDDMRNEMRLDEYGIKDEDHFSKDKVNEKWRIMKGNTGYEERG